MEHFDVGIIGGGPAGLTAALYASRSGLSAVIFEKRYIGGQMVTTGKIENYPGFSSVNGAELSVKMLESAQRFGARVIYEAVTGAELSGEPKIIATEKARYSVSVVIVASGAFPRKLEIPGEERLSGHGVSYCAECDGAFFKGKAVVVAGGGDSAVTNALYLEGLCRDVCLIHRRDTLKASEALKKALEKSKVRLLLNRRITSVTGSDTVFGVEVETVDDGTKSNISCDGVFIAVGRIPESGIFKNYLGTDSSGYIIGGEKTETNLPGVFAAGDVRQKEMRQIVTAVSDGAVAASMAEEYLKMLT